MIVGLRKARKACKQAGLSGPLVTVGGQLLWLWTAHSSTQAVV